ncbi:MAG: hypothetical protein QM763_12290 [Agriterribacter sp.]
MSYTPRRLYTPMAVYAVRHGSQKINIPDFTRDSWKISASVNLSPEGGGTTTVRAVPVL